MKKFISIFILAAFLLTGVSAYGDMDVTTLAEGETLNGMINALLGPGVTISNVSYTGSTLSSGTFTVFNGDVMGVGNGVILTSGSGNLAEDEYNDSDSAGQNVGTPGDALLDSLIPGYTTFDAAILAFDFELGGDGTGSVFINYAFASDEYNEWANSAYNDVFGFFVGPVGGSLTNIALIPGTTIPVAINNINDTEYTSLYNDNDPGDLGIPTPFATEYDGFTDVFQASYDILTAGKYHMKIGVADAGDHILDSAVFIQGGSFSNEPQPIVPVPGAFLLGMLGLSVAGVKLRKHA